MANIKSQIKHIRTNEKARLRNQATRSAVRTEIRKFQVAVEAGDKASAEAQLHVASHKLDKAATKGVFHHDTATSKKSGMAKAFNKLEGQPPFGAVRCAFAAAVSALRLRRASTAFTPRPHRES